MSSINLLLGWRDYLSVRPDLVRGDVEYFCSRAQELRDLVVRVLSGGLSEGAEQSLGDMCEADMTDFCILIDLAAQVNIPDVEALPDDVAAALTLFVDQEPWRSLAIDNDITVCLTMLRAYGEDSAAQIWHMGDPHILRSISRVFEGVNKEQLGRLAGEINHLAEEGHVDFDVELMALIVACAERAAARLGVAPLPIFN